MRLPKIGAAAFCVSIRDNIFVLCVASKETPFSVALTKRLFRAICRRGCIFSASTTDFENGGAGLLVAHLRHIFVIVFFGEWS